MPYIYTPKGKAREYGEFALNLYHGCTHGCTYCYVPAACHTTREAMLAPRVRPIDQKKLVAQLPALAGYAVFLCFTCDPYQPLDETEQVTRRTIELLHSRDVGVRILTKAGRRAMRDFDILASRRRPPSTAFGCTLTFTDPATSTEWEPGAEAPVHRLAALKEAHRAGIPTWASLEPVIDPAQSLDLIRLAAPYVDAFRVGKWNHDARAAAIDWAAFAASAVQLLERLGKQYYIKRDLAAYLPAALASSSPSPLAGEGRGEGDVRIALTRNAQNATI